MMTANEMINVKDIRNNCLHTNDGYTVTFIEIGGMSMELFSESEKLAYCKNITSIVSRFQFPYKYNGYFLAVCNQAYGDGRQQQA